MDTINSQQHPVEGGNEPKQRVWILAFIFSFLALLVDGADIEQRTQKVAAHERTHNTDDNIGDQSLPVVGLHNNAGDPPDKCPGDDP